ncbi:carbon-nitrogen hydrolase family protein [Lacunimicrobium album]
MIKCAACQIDIRLGDIEGNLEKMFAFTREAAANGAKIIVFPEASLSGYCFDTLEEALPYAQDPNGEITRRVTTLAKDLEVHIILGILERANSRSPDRPITPRRTDCDGTQYRQLPISIFNTALLIGPDGLEYAYRKIHLPYIGVDRWTTPGDRQPRVVEARGLRLGINICYDLAFPELARTLALLGADLIVLPTNWPPHAKIMPEKAAPTRAMENGVYYLASGRVGLERDCQFLGHSLICDPSGKFLAEGDGISETILYADIDPARARNKHVVRIAGQSELHRFGDRRPEFYGEVIKQHDQPTPHVLPR